MLPKYKIFSSFIVICFLFVFLVSINSSAASSFSKAVKQAAKAVEQAAVQPSSSEGAQGLTSLAIPPNEYITTEMDAALQAAQQKAEEFAQQALDSFRAAEAAAEAAKQEAEEFANQVTEAAELAKQSTESAKDAVQAAQQALEELSKQAEEAKVAAEAAKAEVQAAKQALEGLANQATAPTPQAPQQQTQGLANQATAPTPQAPGQQTEVLANQATETAMAAKAALQAAQQAAEELAKQAGEALLAVEAAKQTVQQEKEIFANNMAEAVMNAEATALEAQQKAQELRSKITEAQEKVQQAKETLETARQDVASGNYGEALLVILGAYTGKSDEIQTTLDQLEKLVTASETLYDLGSQAKACVDGNGADYCIQEKLPDPHVPTMSDMGSALDVANLRCSEQVPSKIATVLGRVVGLEGQFDTEEFETKRATVCQAIEKIYNLKYKLQQLEEIREDGFSLLYKYDKKNIKKNGISRTVQHSLDLRFYPDIQESYNTGDISPEFSLDNENSWFKWSDSDKKYLGDILDSSKTEDTGDAACSDSKPYWFKLADRLKFRLKVSSVTASDVTLTACLRVSWKGNHSRELATVTIPAPFGYLDEVTQMKDDAVQGAMNSLTDQIADMLGINDKLDDIANQAADAQAAAQSKSGTSNQPPNGRS
jgi:chemotaxis protein histidine kinase CheA